MQTSQSKNDQTAHISLQISRNVKKQGKQNNQNRAISFVAPSKPSTSRFFRPVPEAGDLSSSSASNRQDIISTFFLRRPFQAVRSSVAVSVSGYLGPTDPARKGKKKETSQKLYNAMLLKGKFTSPETAIRPRGPHGRRISMVRHRDSRPK